MMASVKRIFLSIIIFDYNVFSAVANILKIVECFANNRQKNSKNDAFLHEGVKNATARDGQRHSKERQTPQQGRADATARNGRCHVWRLAGYYVKLIYNVLIKEKN
jgi:hypothetical protein